MKLNNETHQGYKKLIEYLIKQEITPKEAKDIIEKTINFDPENKKSIWKITRFKLYLQKRLEEYEDGYLWKKVDSINHIVNKWPEYKWFFSHYNGNKRFIPKKELDNLRKLIADPRQAPFFKTRYNYYYRKSLKKKLSQEKIDKIR